MDKEQARDFANYVVYELLGERREFHCICLCKELHIACALAKLLALKDTDGDSYFVSNVDDPRSCGLTWGGGWHYEYYKDKEGNLKESCLM